MEIGWWMSVWSLLEKLFILRKSHAMTQFDIERNLQGKFCLVARLLHFIRKKLSENVNILVSF